MRRLVSLGAIPALVLAVLSLTNAQQTSPSGDVRLVQTAFGTPDRLSTKQPLVWGPNSFASSSTITIDRTKRFQKIIGFGGAFTEAAAYNFALLPADQQEFVLQAYWGADGIGYTVGRVHINSCDFCLGSYNFDPVRGDQNLVHFDFNVTHDQKAMLPLMHAATRLNQENGRRLNIFATPWSPPAWMKVPVNGVQAMDGSAKPAGLIETEMATWANYISEFISAYKAQGIDLWGITVQNEPEYAAPWEACVYSPDYERQFIVEHLGPLLRAKHPGLKILAYDHNKNDLVTWATAMYTDAAATKYVDGMAFHWYSGDQFYNVNTTHWLNPDKILLPTEGCNCPGVIKGDWSRAEHYGHDMIGDLNNWAMGWTDWNLLLSQNGGPNHLNNTCDSPMIANHTSGVTYKQPAYYYIGQLSKFIVPDSVRVGVDWNFTAPTAVPEATNNEDVIMWTCNGNPRQRWTWPAAGATGNIQVAQASPQCLNVQNFDTSNGANVQIYQCGNRASSNENFRFDSETGTVISSLDGKCLDVENNVENDGANVQLWQCFGGPNQRWIFNSTDSTIRSQLNGKCLTAGAPFVSTTAFETPAGDTVVVVMNKSDQPIPFKLVDGDSAAAATIPAHAIQTYMY